MIMDKSLDFVKSKIPNCDQLVEEFDNGEPPVYNLGAVMFSYSQ